MLLAHLLHSALEAAADMIKAGSAETILIVDPEICSGHLDFKDRDCHLFLVMCTAMILEKKSTCQLSKFI